MDEKKLKERDNKKLAPGENKSEEPKVRIRFKPGRAADGVVKDQDGYAVVDEATAAYLVSIGYAEISF